MKISPIVPTLLCVAAGVLLSGDAACEYLRGEKSEFDLFSFAVGLYFIGKGLFIHSMLTMLSERKIIS